MSKHLTPSEVVEALIGRPEALGQILKLNSKAAYHWRRGSCSRDAGDVPSTRWMRCLLAHSASRGLGLTEAHLIWGATPVEIERILAARSAQGPQIAAE